MVENKVRLHSVFLFLGFFYFFCFPAMDGDAESLVRNAVNTTEEVSGLQ